MRKRIGSATFEQNSHGGYVSEPKLPLGDDLSNQGRSEMFEQAAPPGDDLNKYNRSVMAWANTASMQ